MRLEARFDSRPVAVGDDGRFLLPPHDPSKGHFVEADLTFEDGVVIRAEMTFGGVYGERLTSALTALPVTSPRGRPWSAEQVTGWLERDGRPLGVFTAKAETGTLLLLRDLRTAAELRWLRKRLGGRQQSRFREAGPLSYGVVAVSSRPVEAHQGTFRFVPLGPSSLSGGLLPLLMADGSIAGQERERKRAPQKLWDSLAVAGAHAASTNRPRAVLLTVGTDPGDESFLTWEQAVHYLESLRVPLYVWSPLPEVLAELDLTGTPRAFSGPVGLEGIVDRIAAELESQTIVWIEGEHLPGEVSLGAAAPEGVELVR